MYTIEPIKYNISLKMNMIFLQIIKDYLVHHFSKRIFIKDKYFFFNNSDNIIKRGGLSPKEDKNIRRKPAQ